VGNPFTPAPRSASLQRFTGFERLVPFVLSPKGTPPISRCDANPYAVDFISMPTQENSEWEIDVAFKINRDDYWAFNRFFINRIRRRLFPLPTWVLVALVGTVVILSAVLSVLRGDIHWIWEMAGSPVGMILGILLLLVSVFAIVLLASKWMIKLLPDEKSGTLGHHRLRIANDGIHDETCVGKSFNAWSGILEIAEDHEHVYLFVDRMAAHILPKRALNPAALHELLTLDS
jgi:hypothetical protein